MTRPVDVGGGGRTRTRPSNAQRDPDFGHVQDVDVTSHLLF